MWYRHKQNLKILIMNKNKLILEDKLGGRKNGY